MKTQITIHLMPYEIDWFDWQSKQLKQCSHYLQEDDNIILDVTLNLNFVDWNNSNLPKEYFINKFNKILKDQFDWCSVISDINEDKSCNGVADKRRHSIQTHDVDQFIYLDCDIIFPPYTLKLLLDASKQVTSEYYIISPQIPKLWDESWDVLMNKEYKNFIWDGKTFIDPYTVITTSYGDPILTPINTFKLGGGWFNLISANLLKTIGIPDSLGPYGPDDTFLMYGCHFMKESKIDVQQYIIENLVVTENLKYNTNIYTDLIVNTNDRMSFRADSEKHFHIEINKLQQKYRSSY